MIRLNFLFRLFFLILLSFQLKAQQPFCGTNDYELSFVKKLYKNNHSHKSSVHTDSTLYCLPLNVFIVRKSDSSSTYQISDLNKELDTLNRHFKNAHIQFYLLPINYINNTAFYDTLSGSEQAFLSSQLSLQDTINIYLSPGLMNVCGVTKFSLPLTPIFLNTDCATGMHAITHELGHYFYLHHTFETYFGVELVNGSNCSTAGDLICDTPADPYPNTMVSYPSCTYTGTATDANNQPYTPLINNIMSYSWDMCKLQLTPQQYDQIHNSLLTDRSYLISHPCSLAGIIEGADDYSFINIYPNPAKDNLNIIINKSFKNFSVSVYDALGSEIFSKEVHDSNYFNEVVDISAMPSGLYLVTFSVDYKCYQYKIIVRK